MAEVKIIVDEKGNATVDVVGGHGPGCLKILDQFKGLGKVKKEQTKPEIRESETRTTVKQSR
jgi:hypothetical protein